MRLASHNTFTYLAPRKWWQSPFVFMARCQRVRIEKQIILGAEMFDLRVRFDKQGNPVICHGLIEFEDKSLGDMTVTACLARLESFRRGDVYCRVVLETAHPDHFQRECFKVFCRSIVRYYQRIHFFGGNDRSDWGCKNPVYDFGVLLPDIDEKHASTTALFPRFPRLDDLCPILYARLFNHRDIEQGTTHDWLMIDFVDIQ